MTKKKDKDRDRLILIVDDEFDLRSTLSMLFELYEFDTLTAINGSHALELLQKRVPDLILSDCMMPVMDGIALARTVRADPALSDIPIILMSAALQQHNLSGAQCDKFIKKPFQFDDLLNMVLQLLPASR